MTISKASILGTSWIFVSKLALEKAFELLEQKKLLSEKIDVPNFMTELIENYHDV